MDSFFRYSIENTSHLNRSSYGLDLDEMMMSELKNINSANQMGLLGPNEMAVPTQDFDCYSDIIVDSAQDVKIPCSCFQLLYTGISDIYSMGVILQKLKVDVLCFVNGSEQKADEIEQVVKANKTVLHRISKMGMNGPFEAYEGRMKISHFQTELLDVNSRGFKFKPSGNGEIEYVRVTGKVKVRAAQNLLQAGAGWLDCEEENSTTHNSIIRTISVSGLIRNCVGD